MLLALMLPSPAVADPVADAYAAYQAGEFAKARDIARGAVAADETVNTLVARKVLVLSLRELGEHDDALAALDAMGGLDLVEADRAWVSEQRTAVTEALAERAPESALEEPAGEPESPPPAEPEPAVTAATSGPTDEVHHAVMLAVGGGFQQIRAWSYGTVGGEVAVRIFGPLWVGVDAQVGFSPGADCSGATEDVGACTAAFTTLRPGAVVRFDGPVEPHVHAGLVLGINGPHYRAVMPGFAIGGGVEIGEGPIAVRPRAEFRLLAPVADGEPMNPGVLVGVDAVLRLGRR